MNFREYLSEANSFDSNSGGEWYSMYNDDEKYFTDKEISVMNKLKLKKPDRTKEGIKFNIEIESTEGYAEGAEGVGYKFGAILNTPSDTTEDYFDLVKIPNDDMTQFGYFLVDSYGDTVKSFKSNKSENSAKLKPMLSFVKKELEKFMKTYKG